MKENRLTGFSGKEIIEYCLDGEDKTTTISELMEQWLFLPAQLIIPDNDEDYRITGYHPRKQKFQTTYFKKMTMKHNTESRVYELTLKDKKSIRIGSLQKISIKTIDGKKETIKKVAPATLESLIKKNVKIEIPVKSNDQIQYIKLKSLKERKVKSEDLLFSFKLMEPCDITVNGILIPGGDN